MTRSCSNQEIGLASYATHGVESRGRRYPEADEDERTPFEHDRDRIIHGAAFRRLEYKTQVFVNHEGDYYRTRLTHTLEVAQLSRSVARRLRLNEDLAETIALSHDLGHPPFGHSGERVLDGLMREEGGFEHNRQSLRIVEKLEQRYPDFPGLNLTFEAREGIAKHSSHKPGQGGGMEEYEPGVVPTLEAQIIGLADEIAYNNHDIDDGLKSGLIGIGALCEVDLFDDVYREVLRRHPKSDAKIWRHRAVSLLIHRLVGDLVRTSREAIEESGITTLAEVRRQNRTLVRHSPEMKRREAELKRWLHRNLYTHHRVEKMRVRSEQILRGLFGIYTQDPRLLPKRHQERARARPLSRVVCDYIAGMTDRYAMEEYRRLFEPASGPLDGPMLAEDLDD